MRFLRAQKKYDAAVAQCDIVAGRLRVVNGVLAASHPKSTNPFCKVVRNAAYAALQDHKRDKEGTVI